MLNRHMHEELQARLRTARDEPDLDGHARAEIEGLRALVARAQARKGSALACVSLL
jgi:hypothetical protein